MNSDDVKTILNALEDLIELKVLIRKVVPTYDLNENLNNQFLSLLKSLRNKLQPLFSKYLNIEQQESEQPEPLIKQSLKERVLELFSSSNTAGLISSNSSKKFLKNMGVDPRQLIITGGPLSLDDYKKLNPNLSQEAIDGIEKKCQRIFRDIKKQDWTTKELVFIYEGENLTDKLILNKLEEISAIIGKNVKKIELRNWEDLED